MAGLKDYPNAPLFSSNTKSDTFYFLYFLLHIPISILIDSALVIPQESQFELQKSLIEFHISTNKDFLLADPPYWLTIFGYIELFVQLPFFFGGAYALYKRHTSVYIFLVIYGLEASLSTAGCLVTIWSQGEAHGLNYGEIINLLLVYLPTYAIPFFMALEVFSREWNPSPSETPIDAKKKK